MDFLGHGKKCERSVKMKEVILEQYGQSKKEWRVSYCGSYKPVRRVFKKDGTWAISFGIQIVRVLEKNHPFGIQPEPFWLRLERSGYLSKKDAKIALAQAAPSLGGTLKGILKELCRSE